MPFDRHHWARWLAPNAIEAKIAEVEARQSRAETSATATDDAYTLQELQAALQIKARPLPPDPDDKNSDRAADADIAIRIFRAETGTDEDDATARLLTCLMHWCDHAGQDFTRELGRAQQSYASETTPAKDAAA